MGRLLRSVHYSVIVKRNKVNSKMSSITFDQKRADLHDKRFAKLAPMRKSLHLFTRMILGALSTESRGLCVGAGVGPELFYLAEAFPEWKFTAVEPSSAMLRVCREKAQELGVIDRISFHEGYLETLPDSDPYDAATCILVSQFLLEPENRINLFIHISKRLVPGGILVSADLASDMSGPKYQRLLEVWARTMDYSGMPKEDVDKLGRDVAVLPPHEIESLIEQGGFDSPTLFFQSILIHAWFSRVKGKTGS